MANVYNNHGRIEIPELLTLCYSGDEYPRLRETFVGDFPTHESGLENMLSGKMVPDNVKSFGRFDIKKIKCAGANVDSRTLDFDIEGAVDFAVSWDETWSYDLDKPLRVDGSVFDSASSDFRIELGLTRQRVPVYFDKNGREFPLGLLDKDYFDTQKFSFGVSDSGISVDRIVVSNVEFVRERDNVSYVLNGEVVYSDADGRNKTKKFRKAIPGNVLIFDTNYSPESAEEVDIDDLGTAVKDPDGTSLTQRVRVSRSRSRSRDVKFGKRDLFETIVGSTIGLLVLGFYNSLNATHAEKMAWRNAMAAIGNNEYGRAVNFVREARKGLPYLRRELVGDLYDKFKVRRDPYMWRSRVVPKDYVPGAEARAKAADAKPKAPPRKKSERVPGAEARRSYVASVAPFRGGDPLGEQYGSMIESQYQLLVNQGREFSGSLVVGYEVGSDGKIKKFVVRSQSDRNALGFGDYLRDELRRGNVKVKGDPGIYVAKYNLGGRR